MEKTMRANRVAISTTDNGFKADFYKTHKHIATISSTETGWLPTEGANKSSQRESYRQYVTENGMMFGIEWNPQDMRTENNKRVAKYSSDDNSDLSEDVINLVSEDITEFVTKMPYEATIQDITIEGIIPMTFSTKGTDLSKLGIYDGRYMNGNWAWATINVSVTLKANDQEIYVSMDVQLVSGQLKKPLHIGDMGYTQTAWNTAIKLELVSAGILDMGLVGDGQPEKAKEINAKKEKEVKIKKDKKTNNK